MNISIGHKTDTGCVRASNQDSYAVLRRSELNNKLDALLVVADGMGGVGGGEVASSIVAQTIPQAVYEVLANRNGDTVPLDATRLLRDAIVRANVQVRSRRKFVSPDLGSMGTTCIAAIVDGRQITFANVGDSRAYLLRGGKLSQITEDHSRVYEEFMAGKMTREEADNSRFRNVITRAVGLGPTVKPDITPLPLEEGDTILLCSDGLNTEVADAEIARILAHSPGPQEACTWLVKAALGHGGRDNVTVVVMRYGNFVPLPLPPDAPRPWEEPEEAEDDTDPEQQWRSAPRGSRAEEDEEDEEDYTKTGRRTGYPAPSRGRNARPAARKSAERRSLAPILCFLLLLAVIAEGVGLYLFWKDRQQQLVAMKQNVAPPPSTLSGLTYGAVKTLPVQPVQSSYLQWDPKGNLVVVSTSGLLLRVTPQGQATPLESPFPSLPTEKFSSSSPAAHPNGNLPHPAPHADIAFDKSGNLYQIDPAAKVIKTYSPEGTRTNATIGKGTLTAPTRIAVDDHGTIYVIDNNRLKKIEAQPPNH